MPDTTRPAPASVECQDCGAGVGEHCVHPRRNWWFMWFDFNSTKWVCPVRRLQALKAWALRLP